MVEVFGVMEDTELEEGEACYSHKDGNDNADIDPDIALSYIDEKIQHVLGHLQKDFEGGVSAENLGAKFGGYGSFLPTYQRSPSIWSQPKSPEGVHNYTDTRSTINHQVEGATKSSALISDAPLLGSHGAALDTVNSLHSEKLASADVSAKRVLSLKSAQALGKLHVQPETANKSASFTDQRKLKVRIKVGSDELMRKTATIYSGLGLDISPSSSGSSAEENASLPPASQVIPDESPASILQIVRTFPVTGSLLLSPLSDKFLCLTKEERNKRDSKTVLAFDNSPGHSIMSDDTMSSVKSSKKRIKSLLRNESIMAENQMVVNETGVNSRPVRKSVCKISDSNGTATMSKLSREAILSGAKGLLFSSDSARELSFECVSDQDCSISDKGYARSGTQSDLVEKGLDDQVASSCKDISTDLKNDAFGSGGKTSHIKVSPFRSNHDLGLVRSLEKGGHEVISVEKEGIEMPYRPGRPSSAVKNKVNVRNANGKVGGNSEKQIVSVVKEKKNSLGKGGLHKSKKDIGMPRDNIHSLSDLDLEDLQKHRNSVFGLSANIGKNFNIDDCDEKGLCSPFLRTGEKTTSKEVDDFSASVESLPKATVAPVLENGHSSEAVPPSAVVINENWVCCDNCGKWRLLPSGMVPEQLPEKWLCRMLNWVAGLNRCEVSEDESTNAVRALYQLPLIESENFVHGNASEAAVEVNQVNVQCPNRDLNPNTLSSQGKKKHDSKALLASLKDGPSVQISPCKKYSRKDLRGRTANDAEQPLSDLHFMTKPGIRNSMKLQNSEVDKHIREHKEKRMSEGDAEQIKMKARRRDEQYGNGTSKRVKTDGKQYTEGNWNLSLKVDNWKVGTSSKKGLSAKALKREMHNNFQEHVKLDGRERLPLRIKEEGEEDHFPSDARPMEMKVSETRVVSLKKRKLNEWKDSQNHLQSSQSAAQHFLASRVSVKEETSDAETVGAEKSVVPKTKVKEEVVAAKTGKSQKRSRATANILSSKRDRAASRMCEVESTGEDQKLGKHKVEDAGHYRSEGLIPFKKDFGPGLISVAATSSSSKVSGSHKPKENFEELKGSPVESVSSSPYRTVDVDKLAPGEYKNLRKDHVKYGKGSSESIWPRVASKEKISGVSRREPLKSPMESLLDENASRRSIDHDKSGIRISSTLRNGQVVKDRVCIRETHCQQPLGLCTMDCCNLKDGLNGNDCGDDLQKSGHLSGMQCKDKIKVSHDCFVEDEKNLSEPMNEHKDKHFRKRLGCEADTTAHLHCQVEIGNVKHSTHADSIKSSAEDKNHMSDYKPTGKQVIDKRQDGHIHKNDIQQHDRSQNGEPFNNQINAQKPELINGESQCVPNQGRKQETIVWDGELPPGFSTGLCDVSKSFKQAGNATGQDAADNRLGSSTPNRASVGDLNNVVDVNKESSNLTASNVVKEAESLRSYADRLKSSGFGFESNEAYFQAALRFLDGASFVEMSNGDKSRNGEMSQMQMYINAAKLCKSCAHEYERSQEMATAALAYKCMEVAYMRIVYCKHFFTNRLRSKLQATLLKIPQGDSPSSSASDVDNLNNQGSLEKAALAKSIGPHAAGAQLVAQNHNVVQLLDFTQDVNFAMEASTKSHNAFTAATGCLEEMHNKEFMASVKRVIDFSFQDVGELVRLVHLARKAIRQ
ncbi:hypothetical protein Ancab_030557 [Ancistrocladus abbreviatus]